MQESYRIAKRLASLQGLLIFLLMFSTAHLSEGQTGKGAWQAEHFSGADPEKRHESAFAKVGEKFYMLGGRGNKKIQVYDPATRQWSNTNTTTKDIHHFQAVTYKDKVYIIGALTGRFPDEDPLENILIYDPVGDELTTGPSIPADRRRGSAGVVVYQDKFYMVGGNRNGHSAYLEDGKTPANVTWLDEYDPATDTWKALPDAPHARDHFAAAVIGDKLYVAAGRRSKQGTPEGTFKDTEAAVDVFDFTTGQWLTGSSVPDDIPTPRAGAAAAVIKGELIVIGGEVDVNPPDDLALATTEVLNPTDGTWHELAPMNLGRHASQAVVHHDTIYLPAGSKTKGATEITPDETFMEVFSFDDEQEEEEEEDETDSLGWTSLRDAHYPRSESQCVLYQGEMYFFSGFSTDITIEPANEKYNPVTNEWTELTTMPSQPDGKSWAVTHSGVALVGDTVWIVGGRTGDHPGPVTNKVWWYKISTDTWSEGPSLPVPAGGGGLGRLGRKLHYVGGFDSLASCDVNYHLIYDLDQPEAGWQDLTASSPMPEPRNHFGTVVLGGKLYTIAGQHGHDGCQEGEDVSLVHVYDPITDNWTQLADFPHPESHTEPGTFALDGKIYVVGGQVEGNKVHEYDPATDQWHELTDFLLPDSLIAPGARILGDSLIVAAGGVPNTANPTNKIRFKSFSRTPDLMLGFNPSELTVDLEGDTALTRDVILYNHTGKTEYTIDTTHFPSWLSITKTNGVAEASFEEITLTFNDSTTAAGTYEYQLIATAPDYAEAIMNITLQVTKEDDPEEEPVEEEPAEEEPIEEDPQEEGPEEEEPTEEEPVLAIDSTEIAPDISAKEFLLYPNPSEDHTILLSNFLQPNQSIQIEVFDVLGKVYKSYQWNNVHSDGSQSGNSPSGETQSGSKYVIQTDDLPSGIYMVRVTQGKARWQQRLIKK